MTFIAGKAENYDISFTKYWLSIEKLYWCTVAMADKGPDLPQEVPYRGSYYWAKRVSLVT